MASLVNVLHTPEPQHYSLAHQFPEWDMAMQQELTALEQNHTWVLTSLPPSKRALTSKWVYKTKYKPDGSIERHKALLVIRGFEQIKDKDYKHTFSPVAKLTTVRIFIAMATAKAWLFISSISIMPFYMATLMRRCTWYPLRVTPRLNQGKSVSYNDLFMVSSRLQGSGIWSLQSSCNLEALSNLRVITLCSLNILKGC